MNRDTVSTKVYVHCRVLRSCNRVWRGDACTGCGS